MMKLSPHEKNSTLLMLEKLWNIFNDVPTETPCNCCQFFSGGICRMADNQAVPKDILPIGCPEWKFNPDSAPF